jgi:hypothetical protein
MDFNEMATLANAFALRFVQKAMFQSALA